MFPRLSQSYRITDRSEFRASVYTYGPGKQAYCYTHIQPPRILASTVSSDYSTKFFQFLLTEIQILLLPRTLQSLYEFFFTSHPLTRKRYLLYPPSPSLFSAELFACACAVRTGMPAIPAICCRSNSNESQGQQLVACC